MKNRSNLAVRRYQHFSQKTTFLFGDNRQKLLLKNVVFNAGLSSAGLTFATPVFFSFSSVPKDPVLIFGLIKLSIPALWSNAALFSGKWSFIAAKMYKTGLSGIYFQHLFPFFVCRFVFLLCLVYTWDKWCEIDILALKFIYFACHLLWFKVHQSGCAFSQESVF